MVQYVKKSDAGHKTNHCISVLEQERLKVLAKTPKVAEKLSLNLNFVIDTPNPDS